MAGSVRGTWPRGPPRTRALPRRMIPPAECDCPACRAATCAPHGTNRHSPNECRPLRHTSPPGSQIHFLPKCPSVVGIGRAEAKPEPKKHAAATGKTRGRGQPPGPRQPPRWDHFHRSGPGTVTKSKDLYQISDIFLCASRTVRQGTQRPDEQEILHFSSQGIWGIRKSFSGWLLVDRARWRSHQVQGEFRGKFFQRYE